jgi:glutathione S-transferase
MKLYLNKASPYARLVLAAGYEKKLEDRIELVWVDPWLSPAELLAVTPFAKVPVLLPDGADPQPLIESYCICEYLDELGGGRRLLPPTGAERIAALRKNGLGRALIDGAFGVVIQRRFGGAGVKSALADRWLESIPRALAALEQDPALLRGDALPDIGDLSIAVGLSYLEFRLPEVKWRADSPRMAKRFDTMAARPSMRKSAPE